MGVGKMGVGEMGVGEMGIPRSKHVFRYRICPIYELFVAVFLKSGISHF